jgi:hypothetical protein
VFDFREMVSTLKAVREQVAKCCMFSDALAELVLSFSSVWLFASVNSDWQLQSNPIQLVHALEPGRAAVMRSLYDAKDLIRGVQFRCKATRPNAPTFFLEDCNTFWHVSQKGALVSIFKRGMLSASVTVCDDFYLQHVEWASQGRMLLVSANPFVLVLVNPDTGKFDTQKWIRERCSPFGPPIHLCLEGEKLAILFAGNLLVVLDLLKRCICDMLPPPPQNLLSILDPVRGLIVCYPLVTLCVAADHGIRLLSNVHGNNWIEECFTLPAGVQNLQRVFWDH